MTLSDSTPPSSDSTDDPLGPLVEEFLGRRRSGDSPTIEEYCLRHPGLADRLSRVLGALDVMEEARPELQEGLSRSGDPGEDREREVPRSIERVGSYRILGELGRGGMGVVYEAEHEQLERRVALKVLSRPSESAAERFRREARAAAGLHHTNIVPVFEVGEDGAHLFYAMQVIDGQSLDHVIREIRALRARGGEASGGAADRSPAGTPSARLARSVVDGDFMASTLVASNSRNARVEPGTATPRAEGTADRTAGSRGSSSSTLGSDGSRSGRSRYYHSVAALARQAAEALGYSHARGILHRDIKPSNLILDPATDRMSRTMPTNFARSYIVASRSTRGVWAGVFSNQ